MRTETCWEFFKCKNTDCPQYNWIGVHCWDNMLSHCGGHMVDKKNFKEMSENDPKAYCHSCMYYKKYHEDASAL